MAKDIQDESDLISCIFYHMCRDSSKYTISTLYGLVSKVDGMIQLSYEYNIGCITRLVSVLQVGYHNSPYMVEGLWGIIDATDTSYKISFPILSVVGRVGYNGIYKYFTTSYAQVAWHWCLPHICPPCSVFGMARVITKIFSMIGFLGLLLWVRNNTSLL
ncbi:hypothetical protein F4810DRAFT_650056, partial [Camillea tinctor]